VCREATGVKCAGCWHKWYRLSCQSVIPFGPHRLLCSGVNSAPHKTVPRLLLSHTCPSCLQVIWEGCFPLPLLAGVRPYTGDTGWRSLGFLLRMKCNASCPQQHSGCKASVSQMESWALGLLSWPPTDSDSHRLQDVDNLVKVMLKQAFSLSTKKTLFTLISDLKQI